MRLPSPAPAATKNSPRVTPRVWAIFSIEAREGETTPFSTWEMKLGEESVRAARARGDILCSVRSRLTQAPTACCLRTGLMGWGEALRPSGRFSSTKSLGALVGILAPEHKTG
jgi:hypothetical protein